jgi:hypothetical protein
LLSRKTITDSNGEYHFSDVPATGLYSVTPARVNYEFAPSDRSFSLVGNRIEALFSGFQTSEALSPLDTPEFFIRQQYVDLLGREPDAAGFNFWSDQIIACGNDSDCVSTRRRNIAAEFFITREFQERGLFIYCLYAGALGRTPTFNEFLSDRAELAGNASLDASRSALARSMAQRPEFAGRFEADTTAESFVDALIQSVWDGSQLDLANERERLLTRYRGGTTQIESRGFVLEELAVDPALKQAQYNPAFVLTEYFCYLRRNPDEHGYTFWVEILNHEAAEGYPGLVCSFITSAEYQLRFSPLVTHNNQECRR